MKSADNLFDKHRHHPRPQPHATPLASDTDVGTGGDRGGSAQDAAGVD